MNNSNDPMKPLSAYLYYASERRPVLKKEDPDLDFGRCTDQIAAEWRQMKKKGGNEEIRRLSIVGYCTL